MGLIWHKKNPILAQTTVPVSCMRLSRVAMGRRAVDMLTVQIEAPDTDVRTQFHSAELIERESVQTLSS